MKVRYLLGVAAMGMLLVGCDEDSASDPATATRDALNPPQGLISLTGDKKLELRWQTGNAEEELVGYHVFVKQLDGGIADVPKATYPKAAAASFPRCKENSTVFEKFGFPKDEKNDCEGDDDTAAGAATAGGTAGMTDGYGMQEDADAPKPITNIATCESGGGAGISVAVAKGTPQLGEKVCVVTKDSDGKALENGKTYVAFVTAVAGDDKTTLSWTSNFVADTPAQALVSKHKMTIKANHHYAIPADKLIARTLVAADIGATPVTPCNPTVCNVTGGDNNEAAEGIYFGRLGAGNYPQRTFVSSKSGGSIALQARGPQVYDKNTVTGFVPGDEAANTASGYLAGKRFPIYGLQVFDIEATSGGAKNYGKLIVYQPKLVTPADPASDMEVEVTIVMQPKAGSYHYVQ